MANAIMLKPPANAVFIKTFTVPESWETDDKGNPVSVFNAILSDVTKNTGDCFVCYVHGNTATQNFAADVFVFGSTSAKGITVRNNWQTERDCLSSTGSYISAGATIDIYKIALHDFV